MLPQASRRVFPLHPSYECVSPILIDLIIIDLIIIDLTQLHFHRGLE